MGQKTEKYIASEFRRVLMDVYRGWPADFAAVVRVLVRRIVSIMSVACGRGTRLGVVARNVTGALGLAGNRTCLTAVRYFRLGFVRTNRRSGFRKTGTPAGDANRLWVPVKNDRDTAQWGDDAQTV